MKATEVFLLADELGPQGIDIFPNAEQYSDTKIKVSGYAAYVVTNRLDMPGFAFTNIVRAEPGQETYMIPVTFGFPIPDFSALGLQLTDTPDGTVIHASAESFNVLDAEGNVFLIKSGNWFKDKTIFQAIGGLKHLGIIEDFNSEVLSLRPEYIDALTLELHQRYGTCGSLVSAMPLAFDRIKFAIRIFGITEAIQVLKSFDDDEVCFGGILPCLLNNDDIEGIRRLLPNAKKSDSPFLILTNYLRLIFNSLNKLGITVDSIDLYSDFENAIHRFQETRRLVVGICDTKTGEKIIKEASISNTAAIPVLAMAGINASVLREVNFLPFDAIPNEENDPIITEMNSTITNIHDPKAKVDWMNRKIEEKIIECDRKCVKLNHRISHSERSIDDLARELRRIMGEAEAASARVESAFKTLNTVRDAEIRIYNKFDYLRSKLHSEQRNTRITIIIGVILVVFGVVRLFMK